MSIDESRVLSQLETIQPLGSTKSIVQAKMVRNVSTSDDGTVRLELFGLPKTENNEENLEEKVRRTLEKLEGVSRVEIKQTHDVSGRKLRPDDPAPGVKNVLLVMSGKGGVGKSTVAANLALALSRMGLRVGLLDADIYGPSVPTLLGITGRPMSDGEKITPLSRFGIKLMSIGFLLEDPKAAVVWRGPMLHGALMQFLKDVAWGDLDFLLLDLPPGTGDVALTLSQRIEANGAVIVTTPEEVALQDVYKSVSMCEKVGIQILGVIENQSHFICDSCEKKHTLFGSGGGQKVADFAEAPLLAQLPLDPDVRKWGDAGTPVVQASPGSVVGSAFMTLATRLVEEVEVKNQEAPEDFSIDRSGGVNRHLPIAR